MTTARIHTLRRHLAQVGATACALLVLAAFLGVKARSQHRGLELLEWTLFLGSLGGSAVLAVHAARVLDIIREREGSGDDED